MHRLAIPGPKVAVLYLDPRSPPAPGLHAWLGERPLIAYFGAISRANGVEWLVELAARLRERAPELRFLVVGSGNCEREVQDLARRRGVLDRSFFMLPSHFCRRCLMLFTPASLSPLLVGL